MAYEGIRDTREALGEDGAVSSSDEEASWSRWSDAAFVERYHGCDILDFANRGAVVGIAAMFSTEVDST